MKLHLPSRLRKAVLACLATLTQRRRLTRTISTGTVLLGVFSCIWASGARAQEAEDEAEVVPPEVMEEEEVELLLMSVSAESGGERKVETTAEEVSEREKAEDDGAWPELLFSELTEEQGTGEQKADTAQEDVSAGSVQSAETETESGGQVVVSAEVGTEPDLTETSADTSTEAAPEFVFPERAVKSGEEIPETPVEQAAAEQSVTEHRIVAQPVTEPVKEVRVEPKQGIIRMGQFQTITDRTWHKTATTGGELEWHSLTDWGGDSGFEQGDNVILQGFGGNVFLCGYDDGMPGVENGGTPGLRAGNLNLKQALWVFRAVKAERSKNEQGGEIKVKVYPEEVDPNHTLTVTGDLTMGVGAGLQLGEQTTIDVRGKLVTEGEVLLSLGKDSRLSIGSIGETTTATATLSTLTFGDGAYLKLGTGSGGYGTLSMQSVQLDGNATLEMDVTSMTSTDKQLKLKFLGESTDFTQSDHYLTIKLTGLTVDHVKGLKNQGGKLVNEAYYIFDEATEDQGDLFRMLKIVTWDGLYSPFYAFLDPYNNLITIKVKDANSYWAGGAKHDWIVGEEASKDKNYWKVGENAEGGESSYFRSGGEPWHGDVFFETVTGTSDTDFKSYTRDTHGEGLMYNYEKQYSFYKVYFVGDPKTELGENEHIAVSVRGNMTVKKPSEGAYYWFKPSKSMLYTNGGINSGAVDEDGNIHLEGDEHKQHQFQLRIGRADTGNFTEDKLILESTVRFSGNVAFFANVITHFDDIKDPYQISKETELIVGDGAAFYQALNKSKRDADGNITEYGFDGTLTIWSQNKKKQNDDGNPTYGELVYNSLKKGGDIIHLHMEQEIGARLLIGSDDNETHDRSVTLTVEELTGGFKIDGDGDITGDTLFLNDNGKNNPQFDGVIASAFEYSHSDNYSGDDGRIYKLNNSFRGPRLTVKDGHLEALRLRPMYSGVYNWLKGKNDPESSSYQYNETYDTDSRVVIEKGGTLTVDSLTPPARPHEGGYTESKKGGAWCDIVVGSGEGEEPAVLNFALTTGYKPVSEWDVPIKSLLTWGGAEVTLWGKGGKNQALDLIVEYLGGDSGTIKDNPEAGEQKNTLTLKYNKPDPSDTENYAVNKKEFEGEYADFDHYGGDIEVNFQYSGSADYTLNGNFTGDELTVDGTGTLTVETQIGNEGTNPKEGQFVDGATSPKVTVTDGELVLKKYSYIEELVGQEGTEATAGTLTLEQGGSIQSMQDNTELQKLVVGNKEYTDGELALKFGASKFYFADIDTSKALTDIDLYFVLTCNDGGQLSGTQIFVDKYEGLSQNNIIVQVTEDIAGAMVKALEAELGKGGDRAEWQLFGPEGFSKYVNSGGRIHLNDTDIPEDWINGNGDRPDDRRRLYLGETGKLILEELQADLYWHRINEADNDTWEADGGTEKDWRLTDGVTIETAFRTGDNVHFDELGEGHQAVTYSGAVKPKNMWVDDLEYTFTPKEDSADASIEVGGNLTIGERSKATFKGESGQMTVDGTLAAASTGVLEVTGGTFTAKTALKTTGTSAFEGTISVGKDETDSTVGTVTLEEGGVLSKLEMTDGTLNIGDGTASNGKQLELRDLSGTGGTITGGTLLLTDALGNFGGEIDSTLTYEGTLFEIYGAYKGEGLTVESGQLSITGPNGEAGSKNLTLKGDVNVNESAHLVLGGKRSGGGDKAEEVTLEGTLIFGAGAEVLMHGTTKNQLSQVDLSEPGATLRMGEASGSAENLVTGDVTLSGIGSRLEMLGSGEKSIEGTLDLESGADIAWQEKLTVDQLTGDGRIVSDLSDLVITGTRVAGDSTKASKFSGLVDVKSLEVQAGTGHVLFGGFTGQLTLDDTVTLEIGGSIVGATGTTLTGTSELTVTAKSGGIYGLSGAGTLKVGKGEGSIARLTVTTIGEEFTGTLNIEVGSTATTGADITVGNLAGGGYVDGGHTVTVTGAGASGTFGGTFLSDTGLTLKGVGEAGQNNLTLSAVQGGLGAVDVGANAKLTFSGDGKNRATTGSVTGELDVTQGELSFTGGLNIVDATGKVVLGSGENAAVLNLNNLSGGGSITEGATGETKSKVSLNYTPYAAGTYTGDIGVDLEYTGTGGVFSMTGDFTGKHLTVTGGSLNMKTVTDTTDSVTLTGGYLTLAESRTHIKNLVGASSKQNSVLTLTQGGTIDAMADHTSIGKLEVGGNLTLGEDFFNFGDFEATSEGGLSLTFSLSDVEASKGTRLELDTMAGLSAENMLTLNITKGIVDALKTAMGDTGRGEWLLFDCDTDFSGWNDFIKMSDGYRDFLENDRQALYVDDRGYLVLEELDGELYWLGTGGGVGNDDWEGEGASSYNQEKDWQVGLEHPDVTTPFRTGDDIVFNELGRESGGQEHFEVEYTGHVKPGDMWVEDVTEFGADKHYSFKAKDGGQLTVTGTLTLNGDASFGGTVTFGVVGGGDVTGGDVVGDGNLTVTDGAVKFLQKLKKSTDALSENGFDGKLTVEGGEAVLSQGGDIGALAVNGGELKIGDETHEGQTLSVTELSGTGSDATVSGGTLSLARDDAAVGEFGGKMASAFEYSNERTGDRGFTLSGQFTGEALTVNSGKLIITGTDGTEGSLDLSGKTVTVNGGELELGSGSLDVKLSTDDGHLVLTEGVLTLSGRSNIIEGTAGVTLEDNVRLRFLAGTGNTVTGKVNMQGGILEWNGNLSIAGLDGTGLSLVTDGTEDKLIITGKGGSYSGTVAATFALEVGDGEGTPASQEFTGSNVNLKNVLVHEGAELTVGSARTTDATIDSLLGKGTLKVGANVHVGTGFFNQIGTVDFGTSRKTLYIDGVLLVNGALKGTGSIENDFGKSGTLVLDSVEGTWAGSIDVSDLYYGGTGSHQLTLSGTLSVSGETGSDGTIWVGHTDTLTAYQFNGIGFTKSGTGTLIIGVDNKVLDWTGNNSKSFKLTEGTLQFDGIQVTVQGEGEQSEWWTGGTLKLDGTSANKLVGDVTLEDELHTLVLGTEATIEGSLTLREGRGGGTLTWTDRLTVNALFGDSDLTGAAGNSLTLAGGAESNYTGALTLTKKEDGTGGTLTVQDGTHNLTGTVNVAGKTTVEAGEGGDASLKLGGDAGSTVTLTDTEVNGTLTLAGKDENTVTGTLSGTGTLDVDAATKIEKGGKVGTLDTESNADVTLGKENGEGATLTVSDMVGSGAINGAAGETSESKVVLNFGKTGGTYGGAVNVDLEYTGSGDFTLTESFGGKNLTVSGEGSLTLEKALTGTTGKVTLTDGTLTLSAGGTITNLQGGRNTGNLVLGGDTGIEAMTGSLSSLDVKGTLTLKTATYRFGDVTLTDDTTLAFDLTGKDVGTKVYLNSMSDFFGDGYSFTLRVTQSMLDVLAGLEATGGYHLFFPQDGNLTWNGNVSFAKDASGAEWTVDELQGNGHEGYQLYLDSRGYLHYGVIDGELTWRGEDDVWNSSGDSGDHDWYVDDDTENITDFTTGRNVRFTSYLLDGGENNADVKVDGAIKAGTMTVQDRKYTFSAQPEGGDDSLTVQSLNVTDSGTAEFKLDTTVNKKLTGTGKVEVSGGTFTVKGEISDGRDGFSGELDVSNAGKVVSEKGGVLSNLQMSGGELNIGALGGGGDVTLEIKELGGESGTITGGKLLLTADGSFGGDIASSLTYHGGEFTLSGKYTGTGLTVQMGTLRITGANQDDGTTLNLTGDIDVKGELYLGELGGGTLQTVTLVGGLTLSKGGSKVEMLGKMNEVTGNVTLSGKDTTLVMAGETGNTITGNVTLNDGTVLDMASGGEQTITGTLKFTRATLNWIGNLSVGTLTGAGTLTNENGNLTLTGDTASDFSGNLTLENGTLSVTKGTHVLTGSVSVAGTALNGGSLTVGGIGKEVALGAVSFEQANTLTLQEDVEASSLKGANGTIDGTGKTFTLKDDGAGEGPREFTGTVNSNFTYSAVSEDIAFTLGSFGGNLLTVTEGNLTVTAALGDPGGEGKDVKLTGGQLTLSGKSHISMLTGTSRGTGGALELSAGGKISAMTGSIAELNLGGDLTVETGDYRFGRFDTTGASAGVTLNFELEYRADLTGTKLYVNDFSGVGTHNLIVQLTQSIVQAMESKLSASEGATDVRWGLFNGTLNGFTEEGIHLSEGFEEWLGDRHSLYLDYETGELVLHVLDNNKPEGMLYWRGDGTLANDDWEHADGDKDWQVGEHKDITTAFRANDNITFNEIGKEHTEVKYTGAVVTGNMDVDNPGAEKHYSFSAKQGAGDSLTVGGTLILNDSASFSGTVTFNGEVHSAEGVTLTVNGGEVKFAQGLDKEERFLGNLAVTEGKATLQGESNTLTMLEVSGEGVVALGTNSLTVDTLKGSDGGSITGESNSTLTFAAVDNEIFAGGISVTTLTYTGAENAALSGEVSSSTYEVQQAVAELKLSNYTGSGTLEKNGAGKLTITSTEAIDWTTSGPNVTLNGGTLRVESSATVNVKVPTTWSGTLELAGTESNTLTGDADLSVGTGNLTFETASDNTITGTLTTGTGKVTWGGNLNVAALKGNGDLTNENGGNLTLTSGTTESDFEGALTLSGGEGGKLTVEAGNHTLRGNVHVQGTEIKDAELTVGSGAHETELGAVNFSGKTSGTLTLDGDVTATGLTGTSTGASIGGAGHTFRLEDSEGGGNFSGNISSNFEYVGTGASDYTLSGSFTGADLTVTSGDLVMSKKLAESAPEGGVNVTLTDGSLTLKDGGKIGNLHVGTGDRRELNLAGDVSLGGMTGSLTKLTLGDAGKQSTLELTAKSTYNFGNFDIVGQDTLKFVMESVTSGSHINVGEVTLEGSLDIKLNASQLAILKEDAANDGVGRYHLFTIDGDDQWTGQVDVTAEGIEDGWELFLDEEGWIVYEKISHDLIWSGITGDNEKDWKADEPSDDNDWYTSMTEDHTVAYSQNKNVLFNSRGSAELDVVYHGGIEVNNMTVEEEEYSFTAGSEGGTSLNVRGKLRVGEEAKATFKGEKGDVTVKNMVGLGDVEVSEGAFKVEGALNATSSGFRGTLTVSGTGAVTAQKGGDLYNLRMDGGTLTVGSDAEDATTGLTVDALSGAGGTIQGGILTLKQRSGSGNTFDGNIDSELIYDSAESFTLTGKYSTEKDLTVKQGKLTITGANGDSKNLTLGGAVDVSGTLVLGGDAGKIESVTLKRALTLEDGAKVEMLAATNSVEGDVTLSGDGAHLLMKGTTSNSVSGTLTVNEGTSIEWTNTLKVGKLAGGGDISASGKTLEITGGTDGDKASTFGGMLTVGTLKLDNAADAAGGVSLTAGGVVLASNATLGTNSTLTVQNGGAIGNLSGSGNLTVTGSSLILTTAAEDAYTGTLDVGSGASVDISQADISVGNLTGAGTVKGGHEVAVQKAGESGQFGGTFTGQTGLRLKEVSGGDKNDLKLTARQTDLGAVTVENGAKLTFAGAGENEATGLTLTGNGSVELGSGANLTIDDLVGTDTGASITGTGSTLTLNYQGRKPGSFAGSIETDLVYGGTGTYTLEGNLTGNLTVEGGYLTVKKAFGDPEGAGRNVTLTGGTLTLSERSHIGTLTGNGDAAGKLVLSHGGVIDGMTEGTGLSSLQVGEILKLGGGDFRVGGVTLTGDTTLEFELKGETQGTRVHLDSLVRGGNGLTLRLTNDEFDVLKELEDGYHLFFALKDDISDWNGLVEFEVFDADGKDVYDDLPGRLYLDEQGWLHYDANGDSGEWLVWRGDDNVWQKGTDTTNEHDWFHDEDKPENWEWFDARRNVKFTDYLANGDDKDQVTIDEKIVAGNMWVESGDYSFSAGKKGASLEAKNLQVDTAASAKFGVNTTITGNVTNEGNLTVSGNMDVDDKVTNRGRLAVEGGQLTTGELEGDGQTAVTQKGSLTVKEEMTYSGTLELDDGTLNAHGSSAGLKVGDGGGTLNAGEGQAFNAQLVDSTGQLALGAGEYTLGGTSTGAVEVGTDTGQLAANGLTVAGVNGGSENTKLSGTLTVTGGGTYSFAGTLEGDLNLTVTGGTQRFTKGGQTLKEATVTGGTLGLAEGTTVSGNLNVDGRVEGAGNLTAGSLRGKAPSAEVDVQQKLTLTGEGSNYAGAVQAKQLELQANTHRFGSAVFEDVTLGDRAHLEVDGVLDWTKSLTLQLSDAYLDRQDNSGVIAGSVKLGAEKLQLNFGATLEGVAAGMYYLITGLDESHTPDNFAWKEDVLRGWAEYMQRTQPEEGFEYEARLDKQGESLVLFLLKRPSADNKDALLWMGDGVTESHVWRDSLSENWYPKNEPENKDLYFEGYGTGDVWADGEVHPDSMHVGGGEYDFKQKPGTEGGINMKEDGVFEMEGGTVHMQMPNKNIPEIDLEGGTFMIEDDGAIPESTKEVKLNGGTLGFGERKGSTTVPGDGELYMTGWKNAEELAEHLTLVDGTLNIQVGLTYDEFEKFVKGTGGDTANTEYAYTDDPAKNLSKDLVIGSDAKVSEVVSKALKQGVNKTGRFGMTLQWNAGDSGTDAAGTLNVREGRLTLRSYGSGEVTLTGTLNVSEGGTLHLYGNTGQTVTVQSNFTSVPAEVGAWLGEKSESRVVLGYENDGAAYVVNGDNSGYDGVIVLRGNSTSDTAVFKDAAAAGHAEAEPVTKLELHGRALTFAETAPRGEDGNVTVNVEEIKVADGTTNLVGGYRMEDAANDPNAKIALKGKLTGTGVIANAFGTDDAGTSFRHTYTGRPEEFGGTIVAGIPETRQGRAAEEKSDSTWTLNLEGEATVYNFMMAGTGEIQLNADRAITLNGAVGDTEHGYGNTVDLTDLGAHDITLAGASTTSGKLITNASGGNFILEGEHAAWAGTELVGGGKFTLVEGTLTHGKDFRRVKGEDGTQPQLEVDAKGKVDVKGMDVDAVGVGDIRITGEDTTADGRVRHGQLVGVDGNIDTTKHKVTLVFDDYNLGEDAGAMVEFTEGGDHKLTVTQGAADSENPEQGLVLDFTTDGLVALLRKHNKENGNVTDLQITTNGWLEGFAGDTFDEGHLLRLLTGKAEDGTNGYGGLLYELGFTLNAWKAYGGILSLSGTSKDVYLILDEGEGGDYGSRPHDLYVGLYESDILESSKSVVVDHDETFTVHFGRKAGEDNMPDEVNGTVQSELTLHNLIGLEDSMLEVTDERELSDEDKARAHVTVNLVNETAEKQELDDTAYGEGEVYDDEGHTVRDTGKGGAFNVRGQDTTFEGTIKGGETVDFVKKGAGRLTLGSAGSGNGGIRALGGLKLAGGGITLQGDAQGGNEVGNFTFGGENTGLRLTNGADLKVHGMAEEQGAGGEVVLGDGSVFTFDGSDRDSEASYLEHTKFLAEGEGNAGELVVTRSKEKESYMRLAGESTVENVDLTVEKGAGMSVEDAAKVKGGDVTVRDEGTELKFVDSDTGGIQGALETKGQLTVKDGGTLDLQHSTGNSVGYLIGNDGGILRGGEGAGLTVTDTEEESHFSGTLAGMKLPNGTEQGGATLGVGAKSSLTLTDVKTGADGKWNLDISEEGYLMLEKEKESKETMRFADIGVVGGGELAIRGEQKSFIGGDVQVDKENGKKAEFWVELNGETGRVYLDLTFNADEKELDNPHGTHGDNVDDYVHLDVGGRGSLNYKGVLRRDWDVERNNGQWYIGMERRTDDPFGREGKHKNVRAGSALARDMDDPGSAAYDYLSTPEGQKGDLQDVLRSLKQAIGDIELEDVFSGNYNPATDLDRTLASLAGSSISTLTASGIQDVRRQLESLRSRAAMLDTSDAKVNADPGDHKLQAWINAETGYHKMERESWGPGYTLSGWGGTVGVGRDYPLSKSTLGLAITSMYNDLRTSDVDVAHANVDLVYLSAFVRKHHKRLTHTFIGTLGTADITLDRTVMYGARSYSTHADANGMTAGLMYEVTYTKFLNENKTVLLQPMMNIELRHAHVDSFDERGSDAALHANEVKSNVVTLGWGTRMQVAVASDAFGRESIFEGRVLGKWDSSDNTGKANVRLLHGNLSREVESSPSGLFGVEVGAGLTVPVNKTGGTIFIDCSAEFRERYTNVNASAGFRMTF